MTQQNQTEYNLEEVLNWLKIKDYKVTRPFTPRASYSDAICPAKLVKAAIVDTETTGVNQSVDKIIELGIVIVEYCPESGQVYRVLETFNELEYPGMAIPPESTKIHGITDDMVASKKIDDAAVEALLADVSLVIAHNANFDRGFMEARLPIFEKKAWACTYAQIPWKAEGIGSSSLEFLAYRFGFHFSGHRASNDCHALLEVLQSDLPVSGIKVMKMLLETARVPEVKIWSIARTNSSQSSACPASIAICRPRSSSRRPRSNGGSDIRAMLWPGVICAVPLASFSAARTRFRSRLQKSVGCAARSPGTRATG